MANSSQGRPNPHNIDAERALLGAMLINRETIDEAAPVLDAGAFYSPAHAHIYAAIVELHNQGQVADPITVADHLERHNLTDQIGGKQVLTDLVGGAPVANVAQYVDLILDYWQLRKLITVGDAIGELGRNTTTDAATTVDRAEQLVYELTDNRRAADAIPVDDALNSWLDALTIAYESGSARIGLATGFEDLDDKLNGLRPGQLVVAAGRPGMGKTSFGLDIAKHVAVNGHPVLFVSLEMGIEELTGRLVASEGGVSLERLRSTKLNENDWRKVTFATGQLAHKPLDIYDDARATITAIRSQARRTARRYGRLALIVVDYVQLVEAAGRHQNREGEVAEIARGLKKLAREMGVPVVALAQLSRNLESRADKRPMLSDLRESGEIENAADVVVFLYRDDYYNPQSPDRGMAEIIVAKQRNGPTGTVRLAWLGQMTRFANMARA